MAMASARPKKEDKSLQVLFYYYPPSPDSLVTTLALSVFNVPGSHNIPVANDKLGLYKTEQFQLGALNLPASARVDGKSIYGSLDIINALYKKLKKLQDTVDADQLLRFYPQSEPKKKLFDQTLQFLFVEVVVDVKHVADRKLFQNDPASLDSFGDLKNTLNEVEVMLSENRFLSADYVTLGDLYLLPYIILIEVMDETFLHGWNNIRDWLLRIRAQPVAQRNEVRMQEFINYYRNL